jgi:spore coat polysaccharide biosynthesis protein SpsF (cytidylyltransferase family)
MDRTAIVLQARMGSTRLPGKVLARLNGRTMLDHAIARLRLCGLPVIVATTELEADDAVVAEARRLGADVYRGERDNVLARFIGAARTFCLTEIVRATADNPCVEPLGPRRVIMFRQRVGADHVVECGLPIGTAVEAVSLDALERAAALVSDPYDREHVTSFVRRDCRFRALRAVAPGQMRRPGLRLTVDTAEDLEFLREVFASLDPNEACPSVPSIIQAADALLVKSVASRRLRQGA